MSDKPPLIVVSLGFKRDSGSEPGKGFNWTLSLSRLYQVHLVAPGNIIAPYQNDPVCQGIIFHPAPDFTHQVPVWSFYSVYYQWCRGVVPLLQELVKQFKPCGLHHVTLGSFRMLPRYDRLNIPYTLGPIGGGEYTPPRFLFQAGFPLSSMVAEIARPCVNRAFTFIPPLRKVFRTSVLSLATTRESESILKKLGAKNTTVVFPDVANRVLPEDLVKTRRREQMHELRKKVRLVWSARFLWWKGGQLAVEFLRRLKLAGIDVQLDIYTEGVGIDRLKAQVARSGLQEHVILHGFLPREELLQAYCGFHLYVYPTMHDSSSSAVPEAYMTGLPTMTLGIGGPGSITSAKTGLNYEPASINEWMDKGLAMIEGWRKSPELWYQAVEASLEQFRLFLPEQLDATVRKHLGPRSGVYDLDP